MEEGGAGGSGKGGEVAVVGVEVGRELEACSVGISLRVWWRKVARALTFVVGGVGGGDVGVVFG